MSSFCGSGIWVLVRIENRKAFFGNRIFGQGGNILLF